MTTDNEDKPVDNEVISMPQKEDEVNQTKECTPQPSQELVSDENRKENNQLTSSDSPEDVTSTTIQSPPATQKQNVELNQGTSNESSVKSIFAPFTIFNRRDESISIESFRNVLSKMRLPNGMENRPYDAKIDFTSVLIDHSTVSLDAAGIKETDTGLDISLSNNMVCVSGTPKLHGTITVWIEYHISGSNEESIKLSENIQPLMVFPDPKALWKNLDTDPDAPFQSPNEDSLEILEINGKIFVGASKRGRSHAHEGKFRDDCFKAKWLSNTGWMLVAVSDGAGSAEYSRKGADIACSVFIDELAAKLSDPDTNKKWDSIADERKQEQALEHLLITVAHKAALSVNDFASQNEFPTKKFSATFLGYIAKELNGQWLITAIGIGDGAIALIDKDNQLHLLNIPDGGEYVGQTRFLTTPDVWKGLTNPEAWKELQNRAKSVRVENFRFLFSMTDGVSDPMFETDNNLCSSEKWLEFIHILTKDSENPVNLESNNRAIADELLKWLDFWSKGNYDDRTLTILF